MGSTPAEISAFLTSRRARISPEQAGVPVYGGQRRVPGLRREEVAHLAGVSTDYYSKLERGNTKGVSAEVLEAIAAALQLDDTERLHLLDLAEVSATPHRRRSRPRNSAALAAGTQGVLDAIAVPAFVQDPRLDFVGSNRLGAALYDLPDPSISNETFNAARFVFLDRRAEGFYLDFDRARRNTVALLHQAAGRDPDDEELIRLVGLLSTQSPDFRALWAAHDVLRYQRGTKRFRHRTVGDLEFGYESFSLSTEPSLTLLVYTVEAHSATAERVALLGSWSTPHLTAGDSPDATTRAGRLGHTSEKE